MDDFSFTITQWIFYLREVFLDIALSDKAMILFLHESDAGVPLQDTNGQIPSDVGHADKPPVFAGTQSKFSYRLHET